MPNKNSPIENEQNLNEETVCETENCDCKENGKKKKQDKNEDLQAKIIALEEKLSKSEEQEKQTKDSLMRTAAEYENYRKRSQKEHETAFSNGVAYAVLEMLDILDVLEAAADAPTQDEEYKKGVIMTLAKCNEVFEKLGVEEIECMGKEFDPELHNAVMQEECSDYDSGCVCRVIKKGYVNKGGKIVRHAMVCVTP